MSPDAEASRLPTRKGSEPLGTRVERAPAWTATAAAIGAEPAAGGLLGLLRLAAAREGLTDECRTGLEVQDLHLVEVPDAAALAASNLPVVVVDAGPDVEGACAALVALAAAAPGARAIVCASGLDQERINALVAAGAADVVRYPLTPDVLARKLLRVLRRGR